MAAAARDASRPGPEVTDAAGGVRRRLVVRGRDSKGMPRQDYADGLRELDDATLEAALGRAAWLSTFARTRPASDFHWQLDVCRREAEGRGLAKPPRDA